MMIRRLWNVVARGSRPVRVGSLAVAIGSTFMVSVGVTASTAATAGPPPACTAPAATSTSGPSFTATETLCRYFADQDRVVDQRQFSVTVSNTTKLRNNQVISVSWTGAHPTGGIISAEQQAEGAWQEYPVMLMECRGTPAQVAPSTCWTATPDERSATSSLLWGSDYFNPPADRQPLVGNPPSDPQGCSGSRAEYWVHFLAADGTDYPVGPGGCSGLLPPEMINAVPQDEITNPSLIPSDTTYAETFVDGTGTSNFTIATNETNASLGCSTTVACSLVVVPIEGLSCISSDRSCESLGSYKPGQPDLNQRSGDLPVTADFWWSASNWGRHVAVPLTFATPADVCSSSSARPVDVYGSESLVQATQQWNPHFCLHGGSFSVNHVQTPEPAAKNLLRTGAIEAAIQGAPSKGLGGQPYFSTPTVQAPVAMSGFAITYVIDNAGGQPYTQLKLDPRLLAKLMTESYPGTAGVQSSWADTSATQPAYKAVLNNPLSIIEDPEFKALNPTYKRPISPSTPNDLAAATLYSISAHSDVLWALTSYINSDPEARAWLDGQPDPWGMSVNPNYRNMQLPVDVWPLRDTADMGPDYDPLINPCPGLGGTGPGQSRIPDRPLIDNPQGTLAQVAFDFQYSISASETCVGTPDSTISQGTFKKGGPQQLGDRFMIGLVTLGSTDEFALPKAALQTFVAPGSPADPVDPANRVFVTPSNTSLAAAAALLKPDTSVGSWVMPYADYPTGVASIGAYPGALLVSVDVPTSGLPKSDANDLASYLDYVAVAGQTPGADVGQLPGGYLPLTSANGLGNQLAYTLAAAKDVAAQNGAVPPLVPAPLPPTGSKDHGSKTPGSNGSGVGSIGGSSSAGGTSATGSAGSGGAGARVNGSGGSSGGSNPGHGQPPANVEPVAQVGRTAAIGAGFASLALALALLFVLLGGASSAALWAIKRRGGKS